MTGELKMYSHIPEFSGVKDLPSFAVVQRKKVVISGLVCITEEFTSIGKARR